MKTIKLPCYDIEVSFTKNTGTITSTLKEDGEDNFNAAMDALESIILAHAIAGIDIESPAYLEGIETAVDGCVNNLE